MVGYEDFAFLHVEVREGVATVTLRGPDGNSFNFAGHREMGSIFPRLSADERVKAVVLTGAGSEFSLGGDASMMAKFAENDPAFMAELMRDVRDLVQQGVEFDKPVVTALNGPAIGGPLAFALTADIVVVERQVEISDMHILAAVTPGDGNVLFWPVTMGLARAKRYLLTGEPMSAEEAYRFGLVSDLVEEGESLTAASAIARSLAALDGEAMRHAKRALNGWLRLGMPAFEASWAGESITTARPAAAIATSAILEQKNQGLATA